MIYDTVSCFYYVERRCGYYRLFQMPHGSYDIQKIYNVTKKHLDDIKRHDTVSGWKGTLSDLLESEKPLLMDADMNVVILNVEDLTDGALIDEIYRIARWKNFIKGQVIFALSEWRKHKGLSILFDRKEEWGL